MSKNIGYGIVPSNLKEGEVVPELIERNISLIELQSMISAFPRNSYSMFFNSMFEEGNFVFILNGCWYFYDSRAQSKAETIQEWDWNTSIQALYSSFNNDSDDIDRFNSGWLYVCTGEFEDEGEIFEMMKPDSEMVMPDIADYGKIFESKVPDVDLKEIVTKSKIRDIMNDLLLNEEDKINRIYLLIK